MTTPDIELDGTVRLIARGFDVYERVFARGRGGRALSRPKPVRRSGFDLRLRIAERELVADDVVRLTLVDLAGRELPTWNPGAHLDVFLPSGRLRQYSLCGRPEDRHRYRIATRLIPDGQGGSREVHEELHEGAILHVRGPRNAFRLVDAPSYLFVAGGIGITPILPMVQTVAARGKPWRLVYLGRAESTMPFLDELAECRGGDVLVHQDDGDGFADVAAILGELNALPPVPDLYVCGPPPLMDTARQLMRAIDPLAPVFSERFSALPVVGGSPFTVELAQTGKTVEVAADETALTAIRRVLPDVRYSCQQGFCRTCKCGVLGGEIEHRDKHVLVDTERDDSMLICVSRAAAGETLVLDL
ncbi:MAG: oxidoreductase [Solirubrobacteraceae bacterium]|nr:oxidoreductase [Solirubrobacteraceae bacterium]